MSRRRGPPAPDDTSALWSGPNSAVITPTPSSGAPRDAQSTPTRRKTAPLFAPGTTLAGRYRLARFIAAGGMGEVYEAEDLVLGATVALKTIGPDVAGHDQAMERFRRETLLARRVTHPNVCRIFDLGHHSSAALGPDVTFLTMEMLSGETLRQRLLARGPLGVAEALPVIAQMAAGLTAAHRAGVIHRDFKSANVMLVPSPSGGEPRVVVTDFGLASATADNLDSITDSWQIVGTPAYVAPEQIEGQEVTAAADIYAFGVVLYEMVTGRLPFTGDSPAATVLKRFREQPKSPRHYARSLPAEWEAAILRCLERQPGDRFETAEDAVKALRRERVPARRAVRRRHVLIVAGLSALAVIAAGGFAWMRRAAPSVAGHAAPASRRAVAVLGFKNLSGEARYAWLSTALSEMFTTELAAGAHVRTIPGANVARMKADLALADTDSVGSATLARIRQHTGADVVLVGSYLALGNRPTERLRLDLRLQDVASGETVASIDETGTEAELFDLVSRAGRGLRQRLDVGPLSSAEAGTLRASLPSNAEAARLYAEGIARLRNFDALAARSLLEEATQADPGYAPAQAALADAWAALGYDIKAAEAARKAYDGAADVSREERLAIEGRLREASHDWVRAVEVYRSLWTFFPDDLEHGLRLAAAQIAAGKGKDARATLAALQKLPAPASEDPRIELTAALASEALSDFRAERDEAAKAAAAAGARGASLVVARARLAEAFALRSLGQPRPAIDTARAAGQLYDAAGDRGGVALSLRLVSMGLWDEGDLSGARQAAEQGLAIRREIGDEQGTARMLDRLGDVLEWQGDWAGARRCHEEALALFRQIGDHYGGAVATFNLANVRSKAGDHDVAQAGYEAALAVFREVGNQKGIGTALIGLGNEMRARGDLGTARRRYEEALSVLRATGDMMNQSLCRTGLGIAALLRADLDEAQSQLEQGLALAERAQNKSLVAAAHQGLGQVQLRRGDVAGARRRYEEALAMRVTMGEEKEAAESRMLLAELVLADGRPGEAEVQSRQLPGAFARIGAPEEEVLSRAVRARAFLAAGNVAAAEAEVRRARAPAGRVTSPAVRYSLVIADGQVRAAARDAMGATKILEATAAEARASGFKEYELTARLTLGEAQMRLGRTQTAGAGLREVEAEARATGLVLLARQAAARTPAHRVATGNPGPEEMTQ